MVKGHFVDRGGRQVGGAAVVRDIHPAVAGRGRDAIWATAPSSRPN